MLNFNSLVNSVLHEGMTAGGAGSVLGPGATAGYNAQAQIPNADTYNTGDVRIAKPIGKKIIRRNMPKDSIFTGKLKNKHKRKK